MEDSEIIALYWQRNEKAIAETKKKYSHFLTHIARSVLHDPQDAEEAENDTLLHVWNAIPPDAPANFTAYLAKIVRRISIDAYRRKIAVKRGKSEYAVALDELQECVPGTSDPAHEAEMRQLSKDIDRFLDMLDPRDRDIFVLRYFYTESIKTISARTGHTGNHVSVILSRLRKSLKSFLIEEGY